LSQFPSLGILPVGVYSVELTVWSNEGCSNSITQEFEIYPLPIADFSATTVCQGLETVFTDLSTGTSAYPITDWNWMIDGTQSSSEPDTTYIYPTYGNNLAMLEVTNSVGCSSQISQNDILVHPAPIADFSFTSHFCEHDSVFFTDQSFVSVFTNDELISWNWTFDTTGSASGQLSDYIYEEFGAHEVILEVVTNNGCVGMDTQIVDINPLPEVVIDANIFEGCQPLPVQFTSLTTIEEGYHITGWEWTFGDGSGPVYDQHPGHDFMGSEPGDTSSITYDISLTVTSADGCVATVTEEELILVHANPTALFEVNHLVSDLDDPKFIFTDLSSENVVDWDWDFGDGDFSYDQNPQHIYQDTGTYPVMLIVTTINGCMAAIRTTVRVDPVFTFYIPNSFTPNGDGINDYFFGQGEGYNEYNMMVYNRWGEEIFKSNNDEYHWDGSFKGQQVEQSVYVYKFVIYDWQGLLHIFTDGVTLHR
jgi:gliding motility-associated-like protein